MSRRYFCKADPSAVGGVSEVARQYRAAMPLSACVISPTLTEAQVIVMLKASMKEEAIEILHLWAGQFPFATLYARRRGIPVVLDRSSTHIRWQQAVLREEFAILSGQGIIRPNWLPFPDDETCEIQCAEYENSHVVVPGDHAARTFVGQHTEGLSIVPTGVDIARFNVTTRKRTAKLRVLFSGHNWFRKGLVYLLMAGKFLEKEYADRFSYDFNIGSVETPAFRLPQMVASEFDFTNYPAGLDHVYPRIDVAVLPTLEDALPLSADEAMAAGIPVITTPNAGSRVVDGKSGFIVPIRDWRAIADKLLYFADNPSELDRMGREARITAEGATWERYARSLHDVYGGILRA